MDNKFSPESDMPIGLRMSLTQNLDALKKFSNLPQDKQASFIQGAHQVHSKNEMHSYVDALLNG